MEFKILGPLEAEQEGKSVPLGGARRRALLALLLVNANRAVSRDRIVDELWGERAPDTANKMIQTYVSQLRKALPDGLIRTHPSGYSIQVADGQLDVHRFEQLLAEASDALSGGDPQDAATRLREALALWRGPALQEFDAPFAVAESARLEELRLTALDQRIDADLALGRHASLIGELEALVSEHPLRERLRASQMLALYRSGRQAEALAAYRDARGTLMNELGLEPSQQLRDLERRILEQDEALGAPQRPSAANGGGADRGPVPEAAPVRYAQNGDVSLAYQVFGEGELDLLLVTGWVLPMELVWDDPAYASFLTRLGAFSRVILWDKRGTGLSDRFPPGKLPTLEQRMEDLGVVMDAAGCEQAAIFGISEGVALAALFAAAHPARTRALALYGGWARTLTSPDYPWSYPPEAFDALVEYMRTSWGDPGDLLGLWAPSALHDQQVRSWWGRALRLGASPGAALDWLRLVRDVDIRDALPAIDAPTLVAHRAGDPLVPKENSRYIANRIPGAVYLELPGEDHLWWLGDHDPLIDAVERLLVDAPERRSAERVLTTVLVTNVVDSARKAAELGDRGWRHLTSAYEVAVRDQLERFGGRQVSTRGDGFVATFDGPTRAIRSAAAIREAVQGLGLEVGIGLHTGECELRGDEVTGSAVEAGADIGALAAPGEILVSSTLRDLVAGSGIEFEDRGSHRLAGVGGERALLALASA